MKFKRFTKQSFLKEIGRALLGQFLDRFKDGLAERKIELPASGLEDDEYFKALAAVAMAPEGLPDEMFEAVYAIEEMATEEGQERLERAKAQGELDLDFNEDSSRGDMAMQTYLFAPEVLAQKNNELRLARLSSFEYFGSKRPVDQSSTFKPPSAADIGRITGDLNDWFKANNRGEQTACIEVYPMDGEFWFLVRHGDTFARMAKLEKGSLKMLHFRPAKDDVVVYDPVRDEMRVHAGSKGEKELYLEAFGMRLFADNRYFSERKAFTLEPLRLYGADVLDVDGIGGIEWIKFREYEIAFNGGFNEVVIRKADDIFAAAEARGRPAIPDGGRLVRASFDVLFEGEKKPRRVQVRPPNALKLGRYCDASVVQRWLSEKGFRETVKAGSVGVAPYSMPMLPPPARLTVPAGTGLVGASGITSPRPSLQNGDGDMTAAE
jgi:hypothetical protein